MPPRLPTAGIRLRFATVSPDDTRALASAVAEVVATGDLLVLTGDLGAGKTCFTQGLAAGLGIDEPVTSPTFTLANRYRGRLTLHHLDAYRLDSEADAFDLAIDELLDDGVVVVEWGERIAGLLPDHRLVIHLRYADDDMTGSVVGAATPGPSTDEDRLERRVLEFEHDVPDRGLADQLQRWLVPDDQGSPDA